jgi:glycosyltransferase involved in cell wall biosynthesis
LAFTIDCYNIKSQAKTRLNKDRERREKAHAHENDHHMMSTDRTKKKALFIAWAPYSRRSESLVQELDMELRLIHHLKFQRPLYAPFKYVLQAIHTLALCLRERPRVVFVQDPPIFAGFSVYLYTLLAQVLFRPRVKAGYVIDAHTGAFLHPWWKHFRWLQKIVYRHAIAVIATNRTLAERAQSWRANGIAIAGPPIEIPPGEAMDLSDRFNLVMINSFSDDEPLAEVIEAVASQPEVHLYVTGNVRKAPGGMVENKPDNVTFTGFLPNDDYLKLLRGADAVMALTYEDYTLQLGGMEAMAAGKPLITSDLSFLREYFSQGTVHVPNHARGVRTGIQQMQRNRERLKTEVAGLQRLHKQEWLAESQQLLELIAI